MNNSAPGPDGVTYRVLIQADPGGALLAALYNKCQELRGVPSGWKASNTVLIYKKGDREDLSNWRPIAMGNTIAKLFSALVADRLTVWARANKRLSRSQKGFLPFEGCYEHNFVLQEAIRDARVGKRQFCVAWLDLQNAFGSVPHAAIRRALHLHQVPRETRELVEAMYSGVSTKIRTAAGYSRSVEILSGVRQGCPLSPIVFNLTMESLLQKLGRSGLGYPLNGRIVSDLAYADDIAILADSPEALQSLLDIADQAAESMGLVFKPSKCASLHLGSRGARVLPTKFKIRGVEMRALEEGESYDHLGTPTGFQVRQTPYTSIAQVLSDIDAIDASLLTPWQKIDAVATFVLTRLDFCLRGSNIEKVALETIDKHIRRRAKSWLYLPQRASAEVVYLPPREGGGGLLPLADLADVSTISHGFRLLTCPDREVATLARTKLEEVVRKKLNRAVDEQDIAQYLSGITSGDFSRPSNDTRSMWSSVRNATRRQRERLGVRWTVAGEGRFALESRGDAGVNIETLPSERHLVVTRLRNSITQHYRASLLAKKDQGKVFEVSSRCSVSNHFMRDGRNTRFADWRFIHRARLDVVPLNGNRRWVSGGDKRCRRCGDPTLAETLPHVLCHCKAHTVAIQRRHNSVVDRLKTACRAPGMILANQAMPGVVVAELRGLRPDLTIVNEDKKTVTIVDVTTPFENRSVSFDDAIERKLTKYRLFAEDLERRGYQTLVDMFVIGALGSWDPRNK